MTYQGKIIKGGKVALPAGLRRERGWSDGDMLIFEENEDGIIQVRTYDEVLDEIQAWGRTLARPGVSIVDELIADRRAEAAREFDENG